MYCAESFMYYDKGCITKATTSFVKSLIFDVSRRLAKVKLCLDEDKNIQEFHVDDVWILNHTFLHNMVTNMELPCWVYATMKGFCRMWLKEKMQVKWEGESRYRSDKSNESEANLWSIDCLDRFDDNTMTQIDRMI